MMVCRANTVHANMLSQKEDPLKSENAVVFSLTQFGCPASELIVSSDSGEEDAKMLL